MYKNV